MPENRHLMYRERCHSFDKEEKRLAGKANMVSSYRIGIFLAGIIGIVYFANEKSFSAVGIIFLLTTALFAWLIRVHQKIRFRKNHQHFLKVINRQAEARLSHDFREIENGMDLMDQEHPYANDLDIFGQNSLYQLVNHTTTPGGRKLLANRLKKSLPDIYWADIQQSVKELSDRLDWIQHFQAWGLHGGPKQPEHDFLKWIKSPDLVQKPVFLQVLANLFSVVAIFIVAGWLLAGWPFSYVALIFIVNAGIIYLYHNKVKRVSDQAVQSVSVLAAYELMIKNLEDSTFESEHLRKLQQKLSQSELKSSTAIRKLKKILDLLDARVNMLYWLINLLLMFDLRLLLQAEKWKRRTSQYIHTWFESVHEFEYINSLAAYTHAHPDFVFAELSESKYELEATALGHPLIKPVQRVHNSFHLNCDSKIALVTGSNMAGKSTFLRTVGINLILAQMGAPVCASRFVTSRLQVFTSMRTQDNLEENVSSFYAELQRIRQLLDLIPASEVPVLFMLDELLKGTNSRDRHKGAMALVRQLHGMDTCGLVSTHDLELSVLEDELEGVTNYSFKSDLREGSLVFDYTLHKGVNESFNASILMQQMGINMKEDDLPD